MEEARIRATGDIWDAVEFSELDAVTRDALRADLSCPACGADAYFVRRARNGRRACFGARPHDEECELASLATEGGGAADLDEVDERINAGDVFRIDPIRNSPIRHVTHDPNRPKADAGAAVRYTKRGGREVRRSSMGLARLLRQLVLRPRFRRSDTLLVMSDDTRQTVRSGCVHLTDVQEKHRGRLRVYWGVIRFPKPKEDGGAWLNTGRGLPTIVIDEDDLDELMHRVGIRDLDDLAGAYFAIMGRLRLSNGRWYLFVNDVDWFAVRLFGEDEEIN